MSSRVRTCVLLVWLLLLVGCSSADRATELAIVPEAPIEVPTTVATTAPLQLPTATPTPEPSATPVPPTVTPVPPTPTATPVPPTPVPPTPVPPTPVPEPTPIPATPVPPTAVPEPTPEPTAVPPTATPEPEAEPTAVPATGGPPAEHEVTNVGYVTLGNAGNVPVLIPSALVELIGFHEASHPGSQEINAAFTGLEMMLLSSRGRGTPARSAADIVVPPGEPLLAPVTGTVVAAKTYILYCKHEDKLVYIEPDGMPGWQVRLFHVQGTIPNVGDRVIAGQTVVASGGANPLPFESQIDEFTAEPSWPHTHLEVVDMSVPDDRPPGGGC